MAILDTLTKKVNILPTGIPTPVHLSQSENGRTLSFEIIGGSGELPAGSVVTLNGTKPDGVVYSAVGTLSGNIATFEEDVQLTAAAGVWPAKIEVTNGGHMIATGRISFTIDADPVAPGSVPSESELDGLVAQAAMYAENARSAAYGSPLTAATAADMIDTTRVYVYTGNETGMENGHWYYWEDGAWKDGGIYNAAAVQTDTSLSIPGMAADAKATGEAIAAEATAREQADTDLKADLDESVTDLKSAYNNKFAEFETDSNNLWVNTYGTINGVTFTPNGHGGFKISGTATADGALRYTFDTPITLNGYRLQFRQAKNESGKMIIRCRNASYGIVRNLPANGLSGFSVDSATTTIKYLDITVLSGVVLDTELYVGLTETTAESVLFPQKIVNAYYSKFADFIGEPTVDIDFWGDSLTQGYGGNGVTFPNTCATIMGASYRNLAHGGETANTIAAREGGNAWIMPAGSVNGDYTLADMNDVFGGKVTPLRQIADDVTAKTIYVNGIACTLTRKSQTSPTSDDIIYTVSGYTGVALPVPTPCRFIGSDNKAKITVIFVGTNGQTVGDVTDVNARITIIDSMIAHLKHKNYIVMGLSNGNDSTRNADDEAMLAHYGNNFFATRKELVNNGLTIQGLTPTANDLVYINAGTVPESLRIDATHLNGQGYNALGKLLAHKMFSLGFDKIIS